MIQKILRAFRTSRKSVWPVANVPADLSPKDAVELFREDGERLIDVISDLVNSAYVPLDQHTARVQGLIDANSKLVQERREAAASAEDANEQALQALMVARSNTILVHAVRAFYDHHSDLEMIKAGDVHSWIKAYAGGFQNILHTERWTAKEETAFTLGQKAGEGDRGVVEFARTKGISVEEAG